MPAPSPLRPEPSASAARRRAYEVIFEHDTPAGRGFDVALIAAILASVLAVMLESVGSIRADHGATLRALEWVFTGAFSVEYAVRLWCVRRPLAYARSFFGIVDLLAFLPTYVSVLVPGGQALTVVRIIRVLRIFRILKLTRYVGEANLLGRALRASRYKITVFLITVLGIVVVVGSLMYFIEGAPGGFTSIPVGVYWAIVTLTTVGFGDITPVTPLGQLLASMVMIMGYGIIAVPTGIVTVELANVARESGRPGGPRRCPDCGLAAHDADALHCKRCGARLEGADGG
jgi:voltage-gated potassium channel